MDNLPKVSPLTTNKSETTPLKKVGLFGGTFNPIHLGHIKTVSQGARILGLTKIALVPANIPPHKALPGISNQHRVAMLECVCNNTPLFDLNTWELSQDKVSYSVDTLSHIKHSYPDVILFFFIGMDSLLTFHTWKSFKDILSLCNIVVSTRPGYDLTKVSSELAPHIIDHQAYQVIESQYELAPSPSLNQRLTGHIILLPEENHCISSSKIRKNITSGQPWEAFVSKEVAQYIKQNSLYLDC